MFNVGYFSFPNGADGGIILFSVGHRKVLTSDFVPPHILALKYAE